LILRLINTPLLFISTSTSTAGVQAARDPSIEVLFDLMNAVHDHTLFADCDGEEFWREYSETVGDNANAKGSIVTVATAHSSHQHHPHNNPKVTVNAASGDRSIGAANAGAGTGAGAVTGACDGDGAHIATDSVATADGIASDGHHHESAEGFTEGEGEGEGKSPADNVATTNTSKTGTAMVAFTGIPDLSRSNSGNGDGGGGSARGGLMGASFVPGSSSSSSSSSFSSSSSAVIVVPGSGSHPLLTEYADPFEIWWFREACDAAFSQALYSCQPASVLATASTSTAASAHSGGLNASHVNPYYNAAYMPTHNAALAIGAAYTSDTSTSCLGFLQLSTSCCALSPHLQLCREEAHDLASHCEVVSLAWIDEFTGHYIKQVLATSTPQHIFMPHYNLYQRE
jgi:hypothetical protein